MLRTLLSRIWGTFCRRRPDEECDKLTERFIAQGMEPDEARYAARRQFGGVTQLREVPREHRALPQVDVFVLEISHAFRQFRKSKRFAASAALTMALGIGATTSIFAVVDAVLLRPLPYAEPHRLIAFGSADEQGAPRTASLSYPDFFDFRNQNRVFDRAVSYRDSRFTLNDSLPAIEVVGEIVSWDLFPLLGVQPALGRGFLPEEEKAGTSAVILSHSLWKGRFNGDPGILGRAIRINGRPFSVVGVAKADFQFPIDVPGVQLWVTLAQDGAANQRGARMLDAIGRLKAGVTAEQARLQLKLVARALALQYPEHFKRRNTIWALPELERLSGGSRRPLWILLGSVALLLSIACANVANLLLARGTERSREFALRAALGACRLTLWRQTFIESLVLGLIGAAGGVLLAGVAIMELLPAAGDVLQIPRIAQASLDARVLGFSALLAILTSIVFGLAPALDVVRAAPADALKEGAASIASGRHRLRSVLVVGQIALGLILLIGAEVLIAGYMQMTRRDPGFRTDDLVTFRVGLPEAQYDAARQSAFRDRLFERLRAIPGATAVGTGRPLPLEGHEMTAAFDIEGRQTAPGERPRSDFAIVSPGYFGAMGIPIRKGRDFSQRDAAGAPLVLVINEAFARRFFPGEDALGKRIQSGAGPKVLREIVGVAGDTRQAPLGIDPDPVCYFVDKQLPWGLGTIVLRTAVEPLGIESAVRAAVSDLDRQAAISRFRTGEEISSRATTPIRFPMVLMMSFAAIALVLTVTGLYGVVSYAVSKRQREIGIRIALGAGRRTVLGMVLRDAAIWVSAGLISGSAGAFVAGRLLGHAVFGVQPGDPVIVGSACLLMAATGFAAAYLPAARAASVDPMKALRME
jgi:predicted permease